MSDEIKIKKQISEKEAYIKKVEERAIEREESSTKMIKERYSPKIADINAELAGEEDRLNDAIAKAEEWITQKKALQSTVKELRIKKKGTEKEKLSTLKDELKIISDDKKNAINPIKSEIKDLRKQLKVLQKSTFRDYSQE